MLDAEIPDVNDDETDADDPHDDGADAEPDEHPALDYGTRILKYQPSHVMACGADVVAVQTRLIQLGYDPGKPDGIYGARTAAAVKAFQTAKGIHSDGEVGPDTRKKLAA